MDSRREIDTPLLILAGGLGSRLRSVTGDQVPKPMVDVLGKPFLYWLIKDLTNQGVRRIWLSVGYQRTRITSYPWKEAFPTSEINFLVEEKPQGTGGAVAMFFQSQESLSECIAINGDTHLIKQSGILLDLFDHIDSEVHFLTIHRGNLTADQEPNLCVYGNKIVPCMNNGPPTQFDAGMVKVTRQSIDRFGRSFPCSIHELIMPSVICGGVTYSEIDARCFDIGTPTRLGRYQEFLHDNGLP